MAKTEAEKWMEALRDKKRREKWQARTKKHLAESKIAQARTQAALDSADPDKAIAELVAEITKEREEND